MTTHCQHCTTALCEGCMGANNPTQTIHDSMKKYMTFRNVFSEDPYNSNTKFFAGYHPVYDFKNNTNVHVK